MHTYQSIKNIVETSAPRSRRKVIAKAILKWMEKNRKIENKLNSLDRFNDDRPIEFPSKKRPKGTVTMSFEKKKVKTFKRVSLTFASLLP